MVSANGANGILLVPNSVPNLHSMPSASGLPGMCLGDDPDSGALVLGSGFGA
jgi:hypothetical protein